MKTNLHVQERPHQEGSETPLKSHYSPPILGARAFKHPNSGSRAAKVLGRLDKLSRTREHLYSTPISTAAHRKLSQIPRYVFVGDQPGESEIRLGIFAGLRGDDNAGPKAVAAFIDDLVATPALGPALSSPRSPAKMTMRGPKLLRPSLMIWWPSLTWGAPPDHQ